GRPSIVVADIRVGELVLEIDHGSNAVALDCLPEAGHGHLAAAIQDAGDHFTQTFTVRVLVAVVDEGHHEKGNAYAGTHCPARIIGQHHVGGTPRHGFGLKRAHSPPGYVRDCGTAPEK